MTSTLAGGTLPAAVIWPVKNRPNWFPASITARYPAMLAIEDSTSIFWARLIRGTISMATAFVPEDLNVSRSSRFCAGQKRLITVWSARS